MERDDVGVVGPLLVVVAIDATVERPVPPLKEDDSEDVVTGE